MRKVESEEEILAAPKGSRIERQSVPGTSVVSLQMARRLTKVGGPGEDEWTADDDPDRSFSLGHLGDSGWLFWLEDLEMLAEATDETTQ
mgnify:FL=1